MDSFNLDQILNNFERNRDQLVCLEHRQDITHICLFSNIKREIYSLYCMKCIGLMGRDELELKVVKPFPQFFLQQVVQEIRIQTIKEIPSSKNYNSRPTISLSDQQSLPSFLLSIQSQLEKQLHILSLIESVMREIKVFVAHQMAKIQKFLQNPPKSIDFMIEILQQASNDIYHKQAEAHIKELLAIRLDVSRNFKIDEEKFNDLFQNDFINLEHNKQAQEDIVKLGKIVHDLEFVSKEFIVQYRLDQNTLLLSPVRSPQPSHQLGQNQQKNFNFNMNHRSSFPSQISADSTSSVHTLNYSELNHIKEEIGEFENTYQISRSYPAFHNAQYVYEVQFLTSEILAVLLFQNQRYSLEICDVKENLKVMHLFDAGTNCSSWFQNIAVLDNSTIAFGLYQNLKILDFIGGIELYTFPSSSAIINCLKRFDKDTLLVGYQRGQFYYITRYNLQGDKKLEQAQYNGHEGNIWEIEKFDDFHFVSASSDQTVRIWNIFQIKQPVKIIKLEQPVISIAVNPRISTLIIGEQDGTVLKYRINSPQMEIISIIESIDTQLGRIQKIILDAGNDELLFIASQKGAKLVNFKHRSIIDIAQQRKSSDNSYSIDIVQRAREKLICFTESNDTIYLLSDQ